MKLAIEESKNLQGRLVVGGCKNAVLPIMAGTLLTKKEVVLSGVPDISDVEIMIKVMQSIGSDIKREGDKLIISNTKIDVGSLDKKDMSKIRGSSLLLGPLLARIKYARLVFPGGCKIGKRPIDLHLDGVRRLGADVTIDKDIITVKGVLKAGTVRLDFPSVGATENLIMASVFTSGYTKIENAAREPEICDLCKFLNQLGAKIYGYGTSTVVIEGVKNIYGGMYTPMADRIEAGTYMIGVSGCGGDVVFDNINPRHLNPLIFKLRQMGVNVSLSYNSIRVRSKGNVTGTNIICMPHPAFPTDLQAPMCTLCAIAKGESMVTDKVFDRRFAHIKELNKMGARISVKGNTAHIIGVEDLRGCEVVAMDLRGGGALMLSGMMAKGRTIVDNIKYIERGYENYVEKLSNIGVNISKVY